VNQDRKRSICLGRLIQQSVVIEDEKRLRREHDERFNALEGIGKKRGGAKNQGDRRVSGGEPSGVASRDSHFF